MIWPSPEMATVPDFAGSNMHNAHPKASQGKKHELSPLPEPETASAREPTSLSSRWCGLNASTGIDVLELQPAARTRRSIISRRMIRGFSAVAEVLRHSKLVSSRNEEWQIPGRDAAAVCGRAGQCLPTAGDVAPRKAREPKCVVATGIAHSSGFEYDNLNNACLKQRTSRALPRRGAMPDLQITGLYGNLNMSEPAELSAEW